jgi:hypothetical protein
VRVQQNHIYFGSIVFFLVYIYRIDTILAIFEAPTNYWSDQSIFKHWPIGTEKSTLMAGTKIFMEKLPIAIGEIGFFYVILES